MARGPEFHEYRRKRSGRTDYSRRLKLLKSGKHRLVIRKSNRHIIAQIIDYNENGDIVIASAHSSELEKFGWTFSTSNTPAAYLTGLLCGFRGYSKGIKDAILDIGLNPSVRGSKICGAFKGAIDSGLEIPHDGAIFPDENRIRGEHIASYRNNKEITGKFIEVKEKISNSFKNQTAEG